METKIRVGLIGAGQWGKNHLRVLHELGLLAAVADTNEERLSDIKMKMPGVKVFVDYRELLTLEEIDAVCVATPAATHLHIGMDALLAGKHALIEKPLALQKADGETLVRIAADKGKILMVGHLLHYHPAVVELKKMIGQGLLGELRYITSSRLNLGRIRTEENVLWSIAPHDISLMLNFFNAEPSKISVFGGAFVQPNIEDIGVLSMEFPGNKKGHISTSWLNPFKERKMTIIGEKGMAVFDDVAEQKLVFTEIEIKDENGMPMISKKSETAIELASSEPVTNEWLHFVECIEKGRQPITNGEEGVRVLSVLEQC